ncbi:hypothetical protein JCM11641_004183 [Rhodosporidiobolus odoratus]
MEQVIPDTDVHTLPDVLDSATAAYWRDVGVQANDFFDRLEAAADAAGQSTLDFSAECSSPIRCDTCERTTCIAGGNCRGCEGRSCVNCLEAGNAVHRDACPHQKGKGTQSPFLVDCIYSSAAYALLRINARRLIAYPLAPTLSPPLPLFPASVPAPAEDDPGAVSHQDLAASIVGALTRWAVPVEVVRRGNSSLQDVERAVRQGIPTLFCPSDEELQEGAFADELRRWDWEIADNTFWTEVLERGSVSSRSDFAADKDAFRTAPFDQATTRSYNNLVPAPLLQSFDGDSNLFGPHFKTMLPSTTGPYLYVSARNGTTKWHVDCSSAMNFVTYAFSGKGEAVWAFIRWEDWEKAMKAIGRKDPTTCYSFDIGLAPDDIRRIASSGVEIQYCLQKLGEGVLIPPGCVHTVISLEGSIKVAANFLLPCELRRVKDQEAIRQLFYQPQQSRAPDGAFTTPAEAVGAIDLAQVDEHAVVAVARLGKVIGGRPWVEQMDSDEEMASQSS